MVSQDVGEDHDSADLGVIKAFTSYQDLAFFTYRKHPVKLFYLFRIRGKTSSPIRE
jgi:hypothetical protein